MASDDIFNFINDVYGLLPERDQIRFGEVWKSYEQTYGDIWAKLLQSGLASTISTVPLYNIKRWLLHTFDVTTEVDRAATYRTNQDLSAGLNLSLRSLVRFSIDGGPQLEVNVAGLSPSATTNVEIVTKINAAAGFTFARLAVQNALIDFRSSTSGPTSSITFYPASNPLADASAVIIGLDPAELPQTFPEFPFAFQLIDPLIVSIPLLQDKIREESVTQTLIEGTDYSIEFGSGVITFQSLPTPKLWAKNSLLNLETPYNNFGFLLDVYDKNTALYLKAVKGLWFAFWTGPRPENIRRSLYLLFGLPTASADGVVIDLTPTTITLRYADNSTEVFNIPVNLFSLVALGQSVTQFQPLVSGITVSDKVNSPGFLEREVGRFGIQNFLTEKASIGLDPSTDESKALKTIEQNTYLPQIDVNAFINPNISLANVKTFLRNMQPKSRTFLFQILVGIFDEIILFEESIGQDISFDVSPNLDYNPSLEISQTDLDDTETNPMTANIIDSEGFSLVDFLDVEVSQFAVVVDSFHVEG